MQWLIDIIYEAMLAAGFALKSWVQAQGYLTTSFINRGDPAAYDFTINDFTKDGAEHDLDLSGIVPEGAKAVLFSWRVRSSTIDNYVYFRKKEQTNAINRSICRTQVSGVLVPGDFVCPIGASRKLTYKFKNVPWLTGYFTVKGWWL